jgi:hypothetical protein
VRWIASTELHLNQTVATGSTNIESSCRLYGLELEFTNDACRVIAWRTVKEGEKLKVTGAVWYTGQSLSRDEPATSIEKYSLLS